MLAVLRSEEEEKPFRTTLELTLSSHSGVSAGVYRISHQAKATVP